MENKKKTLVIVDFQKDFCNPQGTLYVPGAEKAKENIMKAIVFGNYDNVIFTVDWHGMDDKSFLVNGGQWPVHCVQYTEGASIDKDIINAVYSKGLPYQVVRKGTQANIEEYGAFFNRECYNISDQPVYSLACIGSGSQSFCVTAGIDDIDICGLAGDYCVYETYKNISNMPGISVNPLYDCMAFIGEPFTYDKK